MEFKDKVVLVAEAVGGTFLQADMADRAAVRGRVQQALGADGHGDVLVRC